MDSLSSLFGLTETLYAVVFAWLATSGPGPTSIDRLWSRRTAGGGSPLGAHSLAPRSSTGAI